jgi:integrase
VRDLLEQSSHVPKLGIKVFLGAVLGLRRGEIAGLRWSDIDREALRLHIRQQATILGTDTPKSGRSRTIPLTPYMVSQIEALGDLDSEYVCPVRNPNLITKQWLVHRRRFGLGDWSFHDLRHAAASTLNALGVDLVTIAAILGHSKVDMALLYANTVEGSARDAVKVLNERLEVTKE